MIWLNGAVWPRLVSKFMVRPQGRTGDRGCKDDPRTVFLMSWGGWRHVGHVRCCKMLELEALRKFQEIVLGLANGNINQFNTRFAI